MDSGRKYARYGLLSMLQSQVEVFEEIYRKFFLTIDLYPFEQISWMAYQCLGQLR